MRKPLLTTPPKIETATEAYATNKQRVEFGLAHLQARLKKHAANFARTDKCSYAHAGDLGHIAELIEQAAEFLGQE